MKSCIRIALCLVVTSAAAQACINDSELPQREREFRSQYLSPMMTRAEPASDWTIPAMNVGGIAMLATAVGAAVIRGRSQPS